MVRLGQDLGHQDEVDPHSLVPVERAGPVVPPAEQPVLVVEPPEHVDQTPRLAVGQGVTLGWLTWVIAHELGRVPHVAVLGRHVEVAAHGHRPIG